MSKQKQAISDAGVYQLVGINTKSLLNSEAAIASSRQHSKSYN
ncbi:MAG TPA: hypothetical protein V6D26_08345 [Stenomitos sp.]